MQNEDANTYLLKMLRMREEINVNAKCPVQCLPRVTGGSVSPSDIISVIVFNASMEMKPLEEANAVRQLVVMFLFCFSFFLAG